MQWQDTKKSNFNKSYVEGAARDARESWFRMVEGKESKKRKKWHKEIRNRQDMRECEAAQACESYRERKRERARRAKQARPDAIRKGNTPVVLNRPSVLIVDSECIK
jgi:hypothetical protein